MIISESWLREWVKTPLDTQTLAQRLTMGGFEVSSISPVAPPLEGVVVGEILSLVTHPSAERLKVCQVGIGKGKMLEIVCGAANAKAGIKIPVALIGAILPNGTLIKEANIQGVTSAGMLCSAAELGLEEVANGLLILDPTAKLGASIMASLQLNDQRLEIEFTPNRGDCLSIAGLAREVVVLTGAKATTPKIKTVAAAKKKSKVPKFKITLLAKKDCPHYVGRIIRNIDPQAVTPIWLKERLRRSGIRSIHPVVDVTNYVMLELGQPMHAFDLAKVEGEIRIRSAQKGETLALLDGKSVNVIPGTLVIADKTRALALAGVMGGAASAVTDDTSAIFLESAYFKPTTISAYARQYGLHSESSHRFERGVDPELQVRAMQRATALLLEICGGDADTIIELTSIPDLPKRGTIVLRGTRIAQLLGFTIPQKQIEMILRGLGMRATKTAHGWRVVPPSHRFDITRECDLIEELARVYGYDKVPSQLPQFAISSEVMPETHIPENRLRQALIDRDYQEVITYSFIDPELQALLDPNVKPMILTNPIASNMAAMRTSLWPGLLQALLYNQNRQQTRLRLFELGRAFLPGTRNKLDDLSQEKRLAGAICGQRYPKQWGMDPENVDFYDLKADIDALLSLGGGAGEVQFVSTSHPALHPSQSAEIQLNGRPMGIMGRAHPQIQRQLGLESPIFLFELLSSAIQMAKVPIFRELSKFPSIRRDLTISVNRQLPAKTVMECASHAAGGLLVNLEIFADYRGEGIDSGRKNLSLSLTLQDSSRTLKDEIVETIMTKVVTALQTQVGAQLRQ